MNRIEFSTNMDRITKTFGDKYYPPEKMNLIFKAMKDIGVEQFSRIVDDFVADAKGPPNRQAFVEARGGYSAIVDHKLKKEIEALKDKDPACSMCHNTGSIYAKEIGTFYTCIFKCTCLIAQKLNNNWVIWREVYRNKYNQI